MKKKIYSILAAASLTLGAAAQSVTVQDVEALSSGETVVLDIHYSDVSGMTSTHFEVGLPSAFTVEKVEATTAWSALFSHEGGVVSGMSTSANAFSGEGDIARMTVTIPAGTAVGTYPVTVSNIRINGANLDSEPLFTIHVVSAHSVILDENSTTAPEKATGVNVTVRRTINAGEWSTICLPFAMTAEQVEEAFGSDVQLADFTGYVYNSDDETITVNFNDATAIDANHPYIIKVSSKIEKFTVDGVDIDPEEEPMVNKGSSRKPKSIIGTYVANTVIENGCLFLSGNKFWYSVGKTKTKGYRAYFDFYDLLPDFEENYAESRITMHFGDDETTGIGAALNDKGKMINDNVYDLQGRRVEKPAKGLYIRNGRKEVVK